METAQHTPLTDYGCQQTKKQESALSMLVGKEAH